MNTIAFVFFITGISEILFFRFIAIELTSHDR